MKLDVTIKPSAKLKRNLNAKYLLGDATRDFLEYATSEIQQEAIDTAPMDLGRLRRSHVVAIEAKPIPTFGDVRVTEPTGISVHEGTRPHWAPIRALQGWAQRHGINPYALQRAIARRGTRPQPWLEEAVQTVRPNLRRWLRRFGLDIHTRWTR